jgi:ribosomal protein S18 acetylase RimI-like enzyme
MTSPNLRIIVATIAEHINSARELFREYQAGLDTDLAFQNFAEELASLPGYYAPPRGRILLGLVDDEVAGCVALRPQTGDACEMKRLYVRPAHRRSGLGQVLCEALIAEARSAGYARMLLDTLPSMARAQALYERLGFKDTEPYIFNPIPGTRFLVLDLRG